METTSPSWSDVPADVLIKVLEALDIAALVRSGAVCRSWNAAASDVRRSHHPQTPFLLYTTASGSADAATLYSLTDHKSYTVRLPRRTVRGRHWLGTSHGWLFAADKRGELHLVNPVTGQLINTLPRATTIEQVKPIYDDDGAVDGYRINHYSWSLDVSELAQYVYLRAFLSSDPSRGDYTVMLLHKPPYQLSFARSGDDRWTWMPTKKGTRYDDCVYHDGLFYGLTIMGAILTFDLRGPTVVKKNIFQSQKEMDFLFPAKYLVRAPWGCWLQIWRELEGAGPTYVSGWKTVSIKVYEVDFTEQRLVETKSLRDYALFIGCNNSFCISTKDCSELLSNHIYYTDHEEQDTYERRKYARDIGIYSLEDDSFKTCRPPYRWLKWPLPCWIVPSIYNKVV